MHQMSLQAPRKRKGFPSDDKLKRPTKLTRFDPVKLFGASCVTHLLRDETNFGNVIDLSHDYNRDPSDDEAPKRDKSSDPGPKALRIARQKVDPVLCLLERRECQKWMEQGVIDTIHVYSDASPVTGVELQGMLLDLGFKNNTFVRRVLPGSELGYGMTGVASKTIVFF